METPNSSQSQAAGDNGDICQVSAKTPKPMQVRSGQNTTAYWKERLYRNTYKDRNGLTITIPEYYVRLRHDGATKQVRLSSSNKDKAAEEALELFARVRRDGWREVTVRHARLSSGLSVEEFCEHYRRAAASMERSPRQVSIRLYCRCLKQLCRLAGVTDIRQLSQTAVERARDVYRSEARRGKRQEASIQNTLAKIIRNAKACFSREALSILKRSGVGIESPFDGVRLTQEVQPVFSLPAHVVEAIWRELPSLRDGNQADHGPGVSSRKKDATRRVSRTSPKALEVDFRQQHPSSYAAIVLALACGLRANEIDKSRWSWFSFNDGGECFLSVTEEDDFKPKGGSARIIKVPHSVYDALVLARREKKSPYILGGERRTSDTIENAESYRCAKALHIAIVWLRERGIESGKMRGNPLHRLRKQFGSEVATHYGLFSAQKLLGHSSPTVTAKYYAAQTELPELTHVRILG